MQASNERALRHSKETALIEEFTKEYHFRGMASCEEITYIDYRMQ